MFINDAAARQQLASGINQLGIQLPTASTEKLLAYLDLLAAWSSKFNLTAIPQPNWIAKHLLDSLSALPFVMAVAALIDKQEAPNLATSGADQTLTADLLPSSKTAANAPLYFGDLGSGAGLPGLPLALALPGSSWFLIEKNAKKCGFLRRCKTELELNNLRVLNSPAESLTTSNAHQQQFKQQLGIKEQLPAAFDCIIFRACGPKALKICYPLLAQHGYLVAMLGKAEYLVDDVISGWKRYRSEKVIVPGLEQESRHIATYYKKANSLDSNSAKTT